MASVPRTRLTPHEYLASERKAETRNEYIDGEVFAMSGASARHVRIVTNLVRELSQQLLETNCNVYSTDLRLAVTAAGLYTYPDVMVACGDEQYVDDTPDTLTNPVVIVEVLSESTKNYDRGQKFESYRALPSLLEYLTVAQDRTFIEHWVRQSNGQWLLTELAASESVLKLQSVPAEMRLANIYLRA